MIAWSQLQLVLQLIFGKGKRQLFLLHCLVPGGRQMQKETAGYK
jgi:hypothetical protein